ncbi:MAG: OB-fold nucleic acid binding domain-containing protein [Desulfurococcaceae archaeon]
MSKSFRIVDLKPNLENITVRVRVLETHPPRTIQTKKGMRTISSAIVGDSTGRVDVTVWGEKAGTLKNGDAIEISGAWTTVFRGNVVLNIGRTTIVNKIDDNAVPGVNDIPNTKPVARGRRGFEERSGEEYE